MERCATVCRWPPTSCRRPPDCMPPRTNATCGNAILEVRPRQGRVDGVRIQLPRLRRRGSSCASPDCRPVIQSRPVPLSMRIAGVQLDRKSASRGHQSSTTVRLLVPSSCGCFLRCRCCLCRTCFVRYRRAHARFVHRTAPRCSRHAPLARLPTPSVHLIGGGVISWSSAQPRVLAERPDVRIIEVTAAFLIARVNPWYRLPHPRMFLGLRGSPEC